MGLWLPWRLVALAFLLGGPALSPPAVGAPSSAPAHGATASELLTKGDLSFRGGDFAAAEAAFAAFLRDFGGSPEAAPALERVKALLAIARVQTGKFEQAGEIIDEYLAEFPAGRAAEDLAFWKGVCLLKAGEEPAAVAAFDGFLKRYPGAARAQEADFMAGAALLGDAKFKEAADRFGELAERARGPLRGRARILRLHALAEADDHDVALAVVRGIDPDDPEIEMVAALHLMALKLGEALRAKEKPREALAAFQRVWPKARIARRQADRLAGVEKQLAAAEKNPARASEAVQLRDVAAAIHREMRALEKVPDYDTALRLRVAQCFVDLERRREAALVLEDAVRRMEPGPLTEQAASWWLQCLAGDERWERLAAAAAEAGERMPHAKAAGSWLLMKAEALQRAGGHAEAVAALRDLRKQFPKFEAPDRAAFLLGYNLLMLDRNAEALEALRAFTKEHPKSPLREQGRFWTGLALLFDKRYPEAREEMAGYLAAFPDGAFRGEAVFRRAQCLYGAKDYLGGYKELEDFLKKFPGHARRDEALVLLGDSFFALGELERGIAVFRDVPEAAGRLFEYAYFQTGKGLRQLERFAEMCGHYEAFVAGHGGSARVVEALHWLAWLAAQEGRVEDARKAYWAAIRDYGDQPDRPAVDDLFAALPRLYKGEDGRAQLFGALRDLAEEAKEGGQARLRVRALWAQAQLLRRAEPERSRTLLFEAAKLADPAGTTARLLADFGDGLREAGRVAEARAAYEGLLKWNPRAAQRDRAHAGLGLLAAAENLERDALGHFELFLKETVQSPLLGRVLRARADILLARRDFPGAIADLEAFLKAPGSRGEPSVRALCDLGHAYEQSNKPDKAVPYYQRVYVMYGRWAALVARAYWRSGQAFEKLNMRTEARNTYTEFTGREDLAGFEEFRLAAARLKEMGG